MARHENPQRPAEIYYPPGHPKHRPPDQPTPSAGEVKQSASQASAPDLGDIIRGIGELASELHALFFSVPDVADSTGRVDPEKFDAATQQAFITCGNTLDYAVRLVSEKRGKLRVMQLRKELAEEMRALGLTGDPLDGESPLPPRPPAVG
jgi:hypothetical protein